MTVNHGQDAIARMAFELLAEYTEEPEKTKALATKEPAQSNMRDLVAFLHMMTGEDGKQLAQCATEFSLAMADASRSPDGNHLQNFVRHLIGRWAARKENAA